MPDDTLSLLALWLQIEPASSVADRCRVPLAVLHRAVQRQPLAPTHEERIALGVERVRPELEGGAA